MVELLIVIAMLGVVFSMVVPRMSVIRESTTLRAGQQQLAAAFSAARSAALQKGKTSTLTMVGNQATVTVRSGLAGTSVRVFGPIMLDESLGITLQPLNGAPRVITYNGRGMMTTVIGEGAVFRYRLVHGTKSDTLCISGAGLILTKQCSL
jgi:Tfp pilus assembly protein FimT